MTRSLVHRFISVCRTIPVRVGGATSSPMQCNINNEPFGQLLPAVLRLKAKRSITLPIMRETAPSNSSQNLMRPGFGPAAEPPRQHTRLRGGMPPDILSLRFQRSERAGVTPRRLRHIGLGRTG
jgi:hypothetical protein